MQNILAAIDFSDVTAATIAQAEKLARAFGCKLWLIHATAPEPDFVGFGTGPPSVREDTANAYRKEHHQLQEWAETLRQKGIDATGLTIQGSTVETILAEVEKLKADLVIVGSHGHGRLFQAIVGSVSEGILRKADCPVLVVPVPQRDRKN
ncbi:MAG: universal stress protein [Limnospira sp.]